jgi:hypothetical protein
MIIAPARKRNAAAGDTAVHSRPAIALTPRLAPACVGGEEPEGGTTKAGGDQRCDGGGLRGLPAADSEPGQDEPGGQKIGLAVSGGEYAVTGS